MTAKNARKEAEREDARTRLLSMLKPGDRVQLGKIRRFARRHVGLA